MTIDRLSLEPSRRCSKGCAFCYNGSTRAGGGEWTAREVTELVTDCAAHGVGALSIGGGEPLEWDGLFETLDALSGVVLRSLTTNGLLLDERRLDQLARAAPDKVHVSIHFPDNPREVERAARQTSMLEARGIASGVNLLVRRSRLGAATAAARALAGSGIDPRRIVFLPMRGADTPSAADIARVAGAPFQSVTCLRSCGRSPRFVSISADRSVAWCSYTRARRRLAALTHAALLVALDGLGLAPCSDGALVRLGARRESYGGAPASSGIGQ